MTAINSAPIDGAARMIPSPVGPTFRISCAYTGNSAVAGAPSLNDDVDFVNNLIVATGGNPQYARNDGNAGSVRFGRTLWAGTFHNSPSAGAGVPVFPGPGDVVVAGGGVLVNPTFAGITGLADAEARFALAAGSPARAAGDPDPTVTADIGGAARSASAPSLGAAE